MPRIFISYRRDDSAGYAGRLYDALAAEFGRKQVFMDVDGIRPGEDFVQRIEEKVAACDVLLALIGRAWVTSADPQGRARLANPEDFVRLEIGHALKRGIPVIPVLVGGASMPRADVLPEELKPLSNRNAFEIHDGLFPESVHRLVQELRKGSTSLERLPVRLRIAGVLVALTLIGGVSAILISHDGTAREVKEPEHGTPPTIAAAQPIKVGVPSKSTQLPAGDAEIVVKPPGRHDVTGPRHAKLLWSAPVTIGDAWIVEAIAADGTVFVWDQENSVLGGSNNGKELWAYRPEPPRHWSVEGFDPEGRIYLAGDDPAEDNQRNGFARAARVVYCFNSKGEGGEIPAGLAVSEEHALWNADPDSNRSDGISCTGGRVMRKSKPQWTSELDGNCPSWAPARDAEGNVYISSDAGTFYALAPDGSSRWTYPAGFSTGKPFFVQNDVVFGGAGGLFRFHEGKLAWKFATNGAARDPRAGAVFDQSGTIYFTDNTNVLAVDQTGKLLWKYPEASPVALDGKGRLYVTLGGGVACLAD